MTTRMDSTQISVGDRFGRLTVEKFGGQDSHRNRYWICRCDCGNTTNARSTEIFKGARTSCGCRWRRKKSMTGCGARNILDLMTYEDARHVR